MNTLIKRPFFEDDITVKRRVISEMNTVKVLVILPKPDSFPNPTYKTQELWVIFAFCMILAFIYFSVLLYMFTPPN